MEDADPGSDLTIDNLCHHMEGFKFHVLHFAACNLKSISDAKLTLLPGLGGFQSLHGGS